MIPKEKIRIIDADDFLLPLSGDILAKNNYTITIVQDCRQGIGMIEKERRDLILDAGIFLKQKG